MTVSAEDRARFERQAAALATEESFDNGTPAHRAALIALTNDVRAAAGIPPLKDDFTDKDELGFHERAIAVGLRRPLR